jgi:hypothetical protein
MPFAVFQFVVAVRLSLAPCGRGRFRKAKHSERVAVSKMPLSFSILPLPWSWSSLRGALCSPVAIQKLIKLLSLPLFPFY